MTQVAPLPINLAAVARMLGISRTRVAKLTDEGQLRRVPGAPGQALYDRREVEAFRETYRPRRIIRGRAERASPDISGETCAQAFELFAEGRSLREIVIALRIAPRTARELYAEYQVSFEQHQQDERARETRAANRELQRNLDRERAQDLAHRRRLELANIQARAAAASAPVDPASARRRTDFRPLRGVGSKP
jgi:hypothetical protein